MACTCSSPTCKRRDYFDNPGNLRGLSPETKQKIADWLRQNPA